MSNKYFLAFVIVVAIIVVGAVAWTGRQTAFNDATVENNTNTVVTNSTSNTNSVPDTTTPVATISNSEYSILAAAETNNVGDITTYIFANNNILNVMPLTMQSAVLNETPVKERSAITVDGVTGERLVIGSAKDGSDTTIVQISNGDKLYDFRGDAEYLSNLSQYIDFTNSN
ncbi:MAG: hypothetical protein ACD_43C00009G0010 [uncultured bacterium]|nr:MAG: hypothetical protein ACD_43C00009G0010 [uncultured bacterium]